MFSIFSFLEKLVDKLRKDGRLNIVKLKPIVDHLIQKENAKEKELKYLINQRDELKKVKRFYQPKFLKNSLLRNLRREKKQQREALVLIVKKTNLVLWKQSSLV